MVKLLDLYCCEGGASEGYRRAGFEVVGVDIAPQRRYPFQFVQADAIEYLLEHGHEYDAIHASPPCQRRTRAQKIMQREHPALIRPTRDALIEIGRPYIIENVPADGHDDDPLIDPVMLCGTMFGLRTYRHRLFESNVRLTTPPHGAHQHRTTKMGRPPRDDEYMHVVGNFSGVDTAREVMGMPWASRDGLREAIPPAYSEYLGHQLLKAAAAIRPDQAPEVAA